MTESPTIKRGLPPRDRVIELLNDTFGDWGDKKRFRWRYDQYPGFQEKHVFWIAKDGELAAFRRMFDKEIVGINDSRFSFFVMGDTCVAPMYQGNGLYSELRDKTITLCRESNRDFSCAFNREGNVPHKVNLKQGWTYRSLPVRLRILSPAAVIQKYAQQALNEDSTAISILDTIGHRFGVSLSDGRISGTDLIDDPSEPAGRTVHLPLPDTVVRMAVETISSDHTLAAAKRHLLPVSKKNGQENITVETRRPEFDEQLLDKICSLYDERTADYDFSFRRERRDIKHMLSHPQLEALVTVSRSGKLVGIAPVCLSYNDDLYEAQVLDLIAKDRAAFEALIAQIESIATEQDADLIVTITDREIGSPWVRVDKQVMMWDAYETDTSPLESGSLLLGLYDVV